jgi:hypothetical protein
MAATLGGAANAPKNEINPRSGDPGLRAGRSAEALHHGYLNRVRSSRRLEREHRCNIEVIWLLGGLKPDFKTIADFRRDNRVAFKSVFRQFVLLCRRLDLYCRELLAVNRTRITAVKQGPQLHPLFAARVNPCSRRAVGGRFQAARQGRCRGPGDKRRDAHEESSREDRSARREARPLPSDAGATRQNLREPDLANGSRPPLWPRVAAAICDNVLYHAQHCYGLTVRRLAKKTGIRRKP